MITEKPPAIQLQIQAVRLKLEKRCQFEFPFVSRTFVTAKQQRDTGGVWLIYSAAKML